MRISKTKVQLTSSQLNNYLLQLKLEVVDKNNITIKHLSGKLISALKCALIKECDMNVIETNIK